MDPGSEFTSDAFAVKMQEANIRVHMSAADSHWQLGRAEVHGCTIKRMLSRMDLEKGIESSLEFRAALRQRTVCAGQTDIHLSSQFSVFQPAAGTLVSDANASAHALAESGSPEGERFLAMLKLRERARRAFIQVDSCSSFRRALLRRSRPSRLDWEKGDYVLYWRRRGEERTWKTGPHHSSGRSQSGESKRLEPQSGDSSF